MAKNFRERLWYPQENKGEDLARKIFTEVDRIESIDSYRHDKTLSACAVYGDDSAFNSGYGTATFTGLSEELTHNIIAPALDTLAAEITQSEQRPMVITVGGSPIDVKNARALTQFVDGKWDLNDVPGVIYQSVMDSLITGLGIARVFRRNERDPRNDSSAVERVFSGNLIIDDRWCVDVMPREFYVKRPFDRGHLASLYPDKAEAIWTVQNSEKLYASSRPDNDTSLEVIEAVHLASAPGRDDGRRTISIPGTVLVDVKVRRCESDYSFLRGMPSRTGWWGESLALRAAPAQLELNKMCFRMQEGHHLITTPKVFVERQSGILDAHLTNDIGTVVEYDGQMPTFFAPQAFGPEFYQHIERLEQWVFKELGISELSAISKKPAGLDSGAALRTFTDIQTRRWIHYVKRFERFNEDIARKLCLKEKEISQEYSGHSVSVFIKKQKRYDVIKWSDIDLDEDRFQLRIFSASALPNTPAGKLQALGEMVKNGAINPQQFMRMADVPDFESVRDLMLAGEDLLRESFQKMLEDEDFIFTPESSFDLVKGRMIATQMAHQAKLREWDEEAIQRLWTWIDDSEALEKYVKEIAAAEAAEQQQVMMDQALLDQQAQAGAQPGAGGGIPAMSPEPGSPMGGSSQADMSVLPGQPAAPQPMTGPFE